MRRAGFLLLLFPLAALAVTAENRPRLLVMELQPLGVTPAEAGALTDALGHALASRAVFDVVTPRDVQTQLGAERQRQLLGQCTDMNPACASRLPAVVAARFVLSGQLARVGSAWQLTLQTIDTEKGAALSRSTRIASTLSALRAQLPWIAAEATGTPLPPPPSRVLSTALLVGGGTGLLAGGVVGLLALGRQGQLNDELCPSGVAPDRSCAGQALRPLEFYHAQDARLRTEKTAAVALMAGGALLASLGIVLMPPADLGKGSSVAVVAAPQGLALAGAFP